MQIVHTNMMHSQEPLDGFKLLKQVNVDCFIGESSGESFTVDFKYPEGTIALQFGYSFGIPAASLHDRLITRNDGNRERIVSVQFPYWGGEGMIYIFTLKKKPAIPTIPICMTAGITGALPHYTHHYQIMVSSQSAVSMDEAFQKPMENRTAIPNAVKGVQIDYPDGLKILETKIEGEALVSKFACSENRDWILNIYVLNEAPPAESPPLSQDPPNPPSVNDPSSGRGICSLL